MDRRFESQNIYTISQPAGAAALGIEAESPQSRPWRDEDLQRKARP